MSPGNYERKSDHLIEALHKEFEDSIGEIRKALWEIKEQQAAHNQWCNGEFNSLRKEIGPIRSIYRAVEWPVKWIVTVISLIIAGAMTDVGIKLAHLISKHFH